MVHRTNVVFNKSTDQQQIQNEKRDCTGGVVWYERKNSNKQRNQRFEFTFK